ncbi:methyl-accepting chemotaxis protein [Vibrio vulnificus]|uniref:methyl-accepting chemotaxis protein n=1 Tax=Vibrio vulnificus TaxID=672 RepID=UPI0010294BC5|nr:methyl-accepting chemotaxis protein [Vibrio vulnificus]RZP71907.1 methyl-accepting chemotaxis protein [Vibrio vulnificus]RZP73087.1 methyl-accepting chemotaxis protein [Vibrio vulnificus]
MKNIKISHLLIGGFALPVVALIGLVILSISQMDTINEQSTVISTNWLPSVQLVERINTQTADLRNEEAVHIISTDASQIRVADGKIKEVKNAIEASVRAYSELVSSSEERALLDEFKTAYQQYLTIQRNLLTLSEQNKNDEAKALFIGNSLHAYNKYSETLLKLSTLNERSAEQASEYGDVIYDRSITLMFILTAVVSFGVVTIAILIARNLLSSITAVQSAMTSMSEGDLTVRVPNQGNNELGLLADSYNKTAEQLASMASQLSTVADNVSASSETLVSTMTQVDANSQQMLAQVEQVAAAVNEMSSTASEMSQNASTAQDSAIEAMTNVDNGNGSLGSSDEISQRIGESVRESADIVNQLNSYSTEIGAVIDVINGISEQTNLLALNAAIEAARAGEHGRGFAVVADEVRSLAAKTQQSTVDIQEIISKLQDQASKADEFMQTNSLLIDESLHAAQQVREAFDGISQSVNAISDVNTLVATASNEQSSVTDDISSNITHTVDMVNENVAGIGDSTKASQMLSQEADKQKDLLAFFRLT